MLDWCFIPPHSSLVLTGGGPKSIILARLAHRYGALEGLVFIDSGQLNRRFELAIANRLAMTLNVKLYQSTVQQHSGTAQFNPSVPPDEREGFLKDNAQGYLHNTENFLGLPILTLQASQLAASLGVEAVLVGSCADTGLGDHQAIVIDHVNKLMQASLPKVARVDLYAPFTSLKTVDIFKEAIDLDDEVIIQHVFNCAWCHVSSPACGHCVGCKQLDQHWHLSYRTQPKPT